MNTNAFTESVRTKAKKLNLKVAYPDALDERVMQAAVFCLKNGIARPTLIGEKSAIQSMAKKAGINLDGIEIMNPLESEFIPEFAELLYEKRKKRGMTLEKATETVKEPIYFAGSMLQKGCFDVVVGGNTSSTGDIIRASLFTVGTAPGIKTISSFFIMVKDDKMYAFGDCAVNPNPDENQLADITIMTAENFRKITGIDSKVAMLSFSTNGSASNELVDKVVNSLAIVRSRARSCRLTAKFKWTQHWCRKSVKENFRVLRSQAKLMYLFSLISTQAISAIKLHREWVTGRQSVQSFKDLQSLSAISPAAVIPMTL